MAASLFERSDKKPATRNKLSYSASMRRIDRDKHFLIANCKCNGLLDPVGSLRREHNNADASNATLDSTLLVALQSYKDKERRWLDDKRKLQNEMM